MSRTILVLLMAAVVGIGAASHRFKIPRPSFPKRDPQTGRWVFPDAE